MDDESEKTSTAATMVSPSVVAPKTDPDLLAPGTRIGEYVIERKLGAGGWGLVYYGRHYESGRGAAIKLLRPSVADAPGVAQRFFREAHAAKMINHPNIVEVFEYGELPDGRPFYTMEYLEGKNLRQYLAKHGRFTPAEALAFVEPIAAALDAAHAAGIVHRDMKSSNVYVVGDWDGQKPPLIKLLDFGVAKLLEPEPGMPGLTAAGSIVGTTQVMSPEQIDCGPVTPATDVYALGVLLYQLLTGSFPYRSSDPREVEIMHLYSPPPIPSKAAPVSRAIDAIVVKAMDKTPANRFPSAGALYRALQEAVGNVRPPAALAAEQLQAVAIHIQAHAPDGGDLSEEGFEQAMTAMELVEQELKDAGFSVSFQAATTLLMVRVLPEGGEQPIREGSIELARRFHDDIRSRAFDDVSVIVNVHAAQGWIRRKPDSFELVGGPLADIADWVKDAPQTTLFVTKEAVLGGVGSSEP